MRYNTGTIISFTLLLAALLINIWQYPQVQEMLDKELQVNLILPILSYKLDNSAQYNEFDKSEESDYSEESENYQNELPNSIDKPTSNQTRPPLSIPTIIVPSLTPPQFQVKDIPAEPINNNSNSTQLEKKSNESSTKEKLPEVNFIQQENLSQDISLQKILPDKNLIGVTSSNNVNSHYKIDLPSDSAAISAAADLPKSSYANKYVLAQSGQDKPLTINPAKDKKPITTIINPPTVPQLKPNIIPSRLINTIDTTLERPIIYE
ncbi:MAG: hypothetical protein LBE18_11075 [Planctomycetaceae bacterium]|nr:hypothetical protein [Planctomycetaceae bacterium]